MREIKFRGLRPSGEFVYGLPSKDLPNSTAYYNEYSYRLCWHPETGGQANAPVRNGTLGQYTGLKDRNGVEIYEGDIVKDSMNNISEIKYETDDVGSCGCCLDWFNGAGFIAEASIEDSEIIGNIHQNPELLEQEL